MKDAANYRGFLREKGAGEFHRLEDFFDLALPAYALRHGGQDYALSAPTLTIYASVRSAASPPKDDCHGPVFWRASLVILPQISPNRRTAEQRRILPPASPSNLSYSSFFRSERQDARDW